MGSSPPSVNDLIHPFWARVIINIDHLPVYALISPVWWDKSPSLCFIQWSFQQRTQQHVWGQPITAPSIWYIFLLFQGWLVVILDLHHGSALSLLALVAHSVLSTVHKWTGTDGVGQIFSPVPFWEDRLANPKCCPFPGWEEAKHEGTEGGGGVNLFPRAREVNTLMFDDSSPRGESPSLSLLSLSQVFTSCNFCFYPEDKLENHLVYFSDKRKMKKSNSM